MTKPQIYGFAQSTYVRAVRIAAHEKGVDYELVPAPPHTPEVEAIHPLGRIPAFRHGDVTLAESKAIATYLDRAFPGLALFPTDPIGAARTEQWVSLVNTAFDPVLVRQYLFAYIFPSGPDKSPDRAAIDAVTPQVVRLINLLDSALAKSRYLAGDSFTFADANLLPIIFYLTKFPESAQAIAHAPHLSAWLQRMEARPSIQATAPPLPS